MKMLFLKYDQDKSKTEITLDGQKHALCNASTEKIVNGHHLQHWVCELTDIMRKENDETEFEVLFVGTRQEFEELTGSINKNITNLNLTVTYKHILGSNPDATNHVLKNDDTVSTLRNVGLAGAATEVVQRYGSANKEFLVAYSGRDNELNRTLQKSHKQISEYKVNPEFAKQNIKQQAGFSAEVEAASRTNAENIISGNSQRRVRYDDLGNVNDQLYDTVTLDDAGNIIPGSGIQIKFVGNDPSDCLKKLMNPKFDKYFENNVKIEVPSDYFEKMASEAGKQASKVEEQLKKLKADPNSDPSVIAKRENQLKKLISIRDKESITESKLNTKDAEFARLHPKLTTARNMIGTSHRAGVEAAKFGICISGSVSLIKNIVSVCKGDKEPEEAALAVLGDTAKGAAVSYASAFAGATAKSLMQNAGSRTVRILSRTNIAGTIVIAGIETGKVLKKFIKGEIDGVQCLNELGEKGTSMLSAAMFAVAGQMAIPFPIVGGMIGSLLGYTLCSVCYGGLLGALTEEKLAREERLKIEMECAEAVELIKQYRRELEKYFSKYLCEHIQTFHDAFDDMKKAIAVSDVDGFIRGANEITHSVGGRTQFDTVAQFDELMLSSEPFKL
jgi:hypothetical protein